MHASSKTSRLFEHLLVDLLRLRGERGEESPCISTFLSLAWVSFTGKTEPKLFAAMEDDIRHFTRRHQLPADKPSNEGLAVARELLTEFAAAEAAANLALDNLAPAKRAPEKTAATQSADALLVPA